MSNTLQLVFHFALAPFYLHARRTENEFGSSHLCQVFPEGWAVGILDSSIEVFNDSLKDPISHSTWSAVDHQ